ncbi:MAG: enoyl-CoA hydratase/isomerase family protein [bacterium]
MKYDTIKKEIAGPVARICLNRPEVRNAFNDVLIAEVSDALDHLSKQSDLRVLIITAEGSTFCAGADFHWMGKMVGASFEENLADSLKLADMLAALYRFPRPTIARVQGSAFGGGVGVAACCDIVVAAESAVFSFSEVRIGLVPACISPFVIRRIGEGHAREYFLTGERVTAQHAHEIGFVNKVVPEIALDDTVNNYVKHFLSCGPEALRACKRMLEEVPHMPLQEARDYTASMIAQLRISQEGLEGMKAFLEKRKPAWNV